MIRKTIFGAALAVALGSLPALAELVSPADRELPEQRTANCRTFMTTDGARRVEVSTRPIHFKAADGSWQPIDTSFAPTAKAGYVCASERNALRSFVPANSDGWVRTECDHGAFLFRPLEASPVLTSSSTTNTAWTSLWPHTTVQFAPMLGGLKETITLASKDAPASFGFFIRTEGLTLRQGAGGSVLLLGGDGLPALTIARPWMQDAAGKRSYAVEVTIQERSQDTVYTLTPDRSWLATATYPVTLDPTVYVSDTVWNGTGASRYPDDDRVMRDSCGYGDPIYPDGYPEVLIGPDPLYSGYECEAVMVFGSNLASIGIPANSTITSATFHLTVDCDGYEGGDTITVADLPFSNYSTTTWNTIETAYASDPQHPSTTAVAYTNGYPDTDFDLSSIVQYWVTKQTAPLGIRLRASSSSNPIYAHAHASDALVITYTPPPPQFVSSDAYSITLSIPYDPQATGAKLKVFTDPDHTNHWYAYTPQILGDAFDDIDENGDITVTMGQHKQVKSLGAGTTYYFVLSYSYSGSGSASVNAPPMSTLHLNGASAVPSDSTALPNGGPEANKTFGVVVEDLGATATLVAETASVVRTELPWDKSEAPAGVYNWDSGDMSARYELIAACINNGLTPELLLDYGSTLYDGPTPTGVVHQNELGVPDSQIITWPLSKEVPYTDDYRRAYARWAQRAVAYWRDWIDNSSQCTNRNGQIIWEIWNEPGCSPKMYTAFFDTAVAYMRQADPTATIIGPSYAGASIPGLEAVMLPSVKHLEDALVYPGMLTLCDGLSFHPYRGEIPEQVDTDYASIRLLLDKYAPGRKVPIIVSECGYGVDDNRIGTAYANDRDVTPEQQAQFVVRQRLFNLSRQIPLTVWFEWRDYAPGFYGLKKGDQAATRRLSYTAAAKAMELLDGCIFQRLMPGNPGEERLLFRDMTDGRWVEVAWTTDGEHTYFGQYPLLPANSTLIWAKDIYGQDTNTNAIDGSPRYIKFSSTAIRAIWRGFFPHDVWDGTPKILNLRNEYNSPTTFSVSVTAADSSGAQFTTSSSPGEVPYGDEISVTIAMSNVPNVPSVLARICVTGNGYEDVGLVPILIRPSVSALASNVVSIPGALSPYGPGWYVNVRLDTAGHGEPDYSRYHFHLDGSVSNTMSSAVSVAGTDGMWIKTNLLSTPTNYHYAVHVHDNVTDEEVTEAPDTEFHGEAAISFGTLQSPPSTGLTGYIGTTPFIGYWDPWPHLFQEKVAGEAGYVYPSSLKESSSLVKRTDPSGIFGDVIHATSRNHVDGFWGVNTNYLPQVLPDENDTIPSKVGMWVRGADPSSGNTPGLDAVQLRLWDSHTTPIIWQMNPDTSVKWSGWRWLTLNVNNAYAPNLGENLVPNTKMKTPVKWYSVVMFSNWDRTDLDVSQITPLEVLSPSVFPDGPVDLGPIGWDSSAPGISLTMPLGYDPSTGERTARTLYVYYDEDGPIDLEYPPQPRQVVHHLGDATNWTVTDVAETASYWFVVAYTNRAGFTSYVIDRYEP